MSQQTPAIQPVQGSGRPVLITIVCIIGFIGVPAAIFLMFSNAVSALPGWYPPLLGVSALIGLVCMIGLWLMRKWAVYTYTAFFAIDQIILVASGLWSPLGFVIPLVFVIIMFVYLSQMR